jgi:TAP-like protein
VNCADSAPFDPKKTLGTGPADSDDVLSNLKWREADGQYGSGCNAWPHATDGPSEPVDVDTPTLVINGRDDSNTPVENAELAAATLPNSTLVAFPGYGHFPLHRGGNACAESIFTFFVTEPTAAVNVECVETPTVSTRLPSVVDLAAKGSLAERKLAELGLSALFPVKWLPLGTNGAVTRDGSFNIQLVPKPMGELLPTLAKQYGVPIDTVAVADINGAKWSTLSGSQPDGEVRLAATDVEGSTLVVAFAGAADPEVVDRLFARIVRSVTPL